MTLSIDVRLNSTSFQGLIAINAARDETITQTVNHLLKLGIEVYLLEDGILEDI